MPFLVLHIRDAFTKRSFYLLGVIIDRVSPFQRRTDLVFAILHLFFLLIHLKSSAFLKHHQIRVFLYWQYFFYLFDVQIVI